MTNDQAKRELPVIDGRVPRVGQDCYQAGNRGWYIVDHNSAAYYLNNEGGWQDGVGNSGNCFWSTEAGAIAFLRSLSAPAGETPPAALSQLDSSCQPGWYEAEYIPANADQVVWWDGEHATDCQFGRRYMLSDFRNFRRLGYADVPAAQEDGERIYPCDKCGTMRTKAEGGTTFTVCDDCWDKLHPAAPADGGEPAFVLRVLRARDPFDCETLLWNFDEQGQIHFQVNCSDTFWWATCDSEEITSDNIAEFEQAKVDATAACKMGSIYADMLFAARVRKMRPMNAAYTKHTELWPLFDQCGPERTDDKTKRPALGIPLAE